jgi:hypothetical protein
MKTITHYLSIGNTTPIVSIVQIFMPSITKHLMALITSQI